MALDRHAGQGKDISDRVGFPIENLAVTKAFKPRTSVSCRTDDETGRFCP
jgi:hypothetical protein